MSRVPRGRGLEGEGDRSFVPEDFKTPRCGWVDGWSGGGRFRVGVMVMVRVVVGCGCVRGRGRGCAARGEGFTRKRDQEMRLRKLKVGARRHLALACHTEPYSLEQQLTRSLPSPPPPTTQDTEPPHLSHLLTQSLLPVLTQHLSHHPKSVTDIWLLVLESESPALESTLAAGISVASAALGDAGIELVGLGVGVSSALTTTGNVVVVDPNGGESRSAAARMTLGVVPALDTVSDIWFTGCAKAEDVGRMVQAAVEAGAGTVHGRVANALVVLGGGSK